jgi:hypothetical protein
MLICDQQRVTDKDSTSMATWEKYTERGVDKWGWKLTCENCERVFHARRSDAKTCSPNCRKTLSRAPQRKQTALADLEAMTRRVNEIATNYKDSQDMLDQMVILKQAIDRALKTFDVSWQPQKLDV